MAEEQLEDKIFQEINRFADFWHVAFIKGDVRLQVDNYVKGLIYDLVDTKRKKDFAAYWESMKHGQPIYTDAVKDTIVRQYERKEGV